MNKTMRTAISSIAILAILLPLHGCLASDGVNLRYPIINSVKTWEIGQTVIYDSLDVQSVSITDFSAIRVPEFVKNLKNVKSIQLHCPRLESLPEWIAAMDSLQEVILHGCINLDMAQVATVLNNSPGIESLGLPFSVTSAASWSQMANLENIKALDISFNNIHDLGLILSKFPNLIHLDIGYGHIDTTGEIKKYSTKLQFLLMNKSDSTYVNFLLEGIPTDNNIQYFSCSNCTLTAIPVQLFQWPKLRRMELSNNEINQVISKIPSGRPLEFLNLSSNNISSERDVRQVNTLNHLRLLMLYGNPLSNAAYSEIIKSLPNTVVVGRKADDD